MINAFQLYSENFDIVAITALKPGSIPTSLPMKFSLLAILFWEKISDTEVVEVVEIKKSIKVTQLPSPNELELISAEIDSSLSVCLIYHPLNSTEPYSY